MLKHRVTFIGVWIALVVALFVFPGFEIRGLAMGLAIGYWPFMIIGESSINPLIIFLVMFVLSGTTVGLFAWLMDSASMTKNMWMLLAFSIIVGGAYFAMDDFDFEAWKRTPAIAAAMESPEVNYQPTRVDFYKTIVMPKTIAGGLWGLYTATAVCFLYSTVILLSRKYCLTRKKQISYP